MTNPQPIITQDRLEQLFLTVITVRQKAPNGQLTAEVLGATPEEFTEFLHYLENTEKVYTEWDLG